MGTVKYKKVKEKNLKKLRIFLSQNDKTKYKYKPTSSSNA